ncbi:unnamed protein product, partial [Didymodactylos carnosus]
LVFEFIQKAADSPKRRYNGIPFELLLKSLLTFIEQDVVKKEIIPYIDLIIDYIIQKREFSALKIIRKLSLSTELADILNQNQKLSEILNNPKKYFDGNEKHNKIIEEIRYQLKVLPFEHQENENKQEEQQRRQQALLTDSG